MAAIGEGNFGASPRCEKVRRAADILFVPVVERRATFAPAVAERAWAWPWSAPFRSAPSIGSWPINFDGATASVGVAGARYDHFLLAALSADRGSPIIWTRFSLSRRRYSIPFCNLCYCGYATWLNGWRDIRRFGRKSWVERIHKGYISLA